MGCSFALALKRHNPEVRIFGIDAPQKLERARAAGAIDGTGPQPCELIVLSTPVGEILKLLENLEPSSAVILDLGSTKVEICKRAAARGLPFVGGHPMTGSERSGPEAAAAELFKGAHFFLCPIASTPVGAIAKLEHLIRSIGALPHVISPQEHDVLVAELSHLPQILSTVLAEQTSENRVFAGPGWKSVTRLAASPFHIWKDILLTSGSLPGELKAYIQRLQSILDLLERNDVQQLEIIFERANKSVLDDTHV